MKAKAILTEGRREIILYLEKRNDKWASPVKVSKEAKTRMGYGGTLKALKEMYEEGFIEHFDIFGGEEKPRYKFRCRQDLSGFKNLTKAVIDTGDVAFFRKYTSTFYFDKWCKPLIDVFCNIAPEIAEMLQEATHISPSVVGLLLLSAADSQNIVVRGTVCEEIDKHFREKYSKIKNDGLLKSVIGCILHDYLIGTDELTKLIKATCLPKRVDLTDKELEELESENTKKSKKKS